MTLFSLENLVVVVSGIVLTVIPLIIVVVISQRRIAYELQQRTV